MKLIPLPPLIPDTIVDMRYTGSRNIAHKPISDERIPRLIEPAAIALQKVAEHFRQRDLRLVIWDAYRTEDVQEALRKIVSDDRYVLKNSRHCQGLAVDLSLATKEGELLDMGTDHDNFTEKAHADADRADGLTAEQLRNRDLLTRTMERHGFFAQWPYEWWHFDYLPKQAAKV